MVGVKVEKDRVGGRGERRIGARGGGGTGVGPATGATDRPATHTHRNRKPKNWGALSLSQKNSVLVNRSTCNAGRQKGRVLYRYPEVS